MASTLQQTTEFPEDITQFDLNDPIEGGPEGIDNEPHLQLAARTNWLRRKLESETRQIVVNDAEGVPHYMVWIPRIILPAGAIGTGIPSQDLYLGGFAVDQFLCAVEGAKAISHPLKLPTRGITLADAQIAAAARVIEGSACELLSAKDWGHLAWLIDLIGHPIEGNIADGAYPGKEEWDGRGEPGTGSHIGVSGPAAWYHNGLPSGIKDLVGNLFHTLPLSMYRGQIVLEFNAELANAISAEDPTINIVDNSNAPQGPFYGWPASDTYVEINDGDHIEWLKYTAITVDSEDDSQALLTGCDRGYFNNNAFAFDAGSTIRVRRSYWCYPDIWVSPLAVALGADPDNDTEIELGLEFFPDYLVSTPQVGDVVAVDGEDMLITNVDGMTCQVTRGHNGTTITTHDQYALVHKYSSTLTRTHQGRQVGSASGPLRTGLLEEFHLRNAGEVTATPKIRYEINAIATSFCRGGSFLGIVPEGGMDELNFFSSTDPWFGPFSRGFRCVWRPTFD